MMQLPMAPPDEHYVALLLEFFTAPIEADSASTYIVTDLTEPARRVSLRKKIATAKAADSAAVQEEKTPDPIPRKRKREVTTPRASPPTSTLPSSQSTSDVLQTQEPHAPQEKEGEYLQHQRPKRLKKESTQQVYQMEHVTMKTELGRATTVPRGAPNESTSKEAGCDLPGWSGRSRKKDVNDVEEAKQRIMRRTPEEGALDGRPRLNSKCNPAPSRRSARRSNPKSLRKIKLAQEQQTRQETSPGRQLLEESTQAATNSTDDSPSPPRMHMDTPPPPPPTSRKRAASPMAEGRPKRARKQAGEYRRMANGN